jgi:hypothetical protein
VKLDSSSVLDNGQTYTFYFQSVGSLKATDAELSERMAKMRDVSGAQVKNESGAFGIAEDLRISATFVYNGDGDTALSLGQDMSGILTGGWSDPGNYSFLFADTKGYEADQPLSPTTYVWIGAGILIIALLAYGFGQGFGARAGASV